MWTVCFRKAGLYYLASEFFPPQYLLAILPTRPVLLSCISFNSCQIVYDVEIHLSCKRNYFPINEHPLSFHLFFFNQKRTFGKYNPGQVDPWLKIFQQLPIYLGTELWLRGTLCSGVTPSLAQQAPVLFQPEWVNFTSSNTPVLSLSAQSTPVLPG